MFAKHAHLRTRIGQMISIFIFRQKQEDYNMEVGTIQHSPSELYMSSTFWRLL
jgi:hypothetical protein